MQSVADSRSSRDEYALKPDNASTCGPAGMNSEDVRYTRDFFPWESIRSDADSYFCTHMSKTAAVLHCNPRSLNQLSSDELRYCKTGTDNHTWPRSPGTEHRVISPRIEVDDRDRFGNSAAAGMDSPPSYVRLKSPRAGKRPVSPIALREKSPDQKTVKWDEVSNHSASEEGTEAELLKCAGKSDRAGSNGRQRDRATGAGPTWQDRQAGYRPSACFARESLRATTAAAYSSAAKRAARPPPRAGVMPGHSIDFAEPEAFSVSRRDNVMEIVSEARRHAAFGTPSRSRPPSVDESEQERKAMLSHFSCAKLRSRTASPAPLPHSRTRSESVKSDRKASTAGSAQSREGSRQSGRKAPAVGGAQSREGSLANLSEPTHVPFTLPRQRWIELTPKGYYHRSVSRDRAKRPS